MKKRILPLITAAILGVTLFTGCGSSSASSSSTTSSVKEAASSSATGTASKSSGKDLEVHIGDQPSFFILKIADHLGYFDEQFKGTGTKIVVDNFVNQGSAIVEAMNSGDVQLGVIGTMPLVTADANGSNFKAISSVNVSTDGFKLFAAKGSGIKSVKDFKGKKIGVKFSSNEHEMLLTLLKKAGLSESDVEIANMSADDCLNSLLSGDIDGSILKGDQLDAAKAGGATIVADNSQSGLIVNYLVGTNDFVKAHPDVVSGVLKVLEKTKQWIDKHPDETVKDYVSLTQTDETAAKTSFESRDRSISIDDDKFRDPLERTVEFLKGQGTIDNSISVDDILDSSYYRNSGVTEADDASSEASSETASNAA